MNEGTTTTIPATAAHIIKRPRLTKLLDETSARIILLVAPAGYGKTTLAREWLAGGRKPFGWFTASPASADAATVAFGVAAAGADVSRDALQRLREAASTPARDPAQRGRRYAEILAEEFAQWPRDRWLVLDDYHFIAASEAATDVVAQLVDMTEMRILVTSRQRPQWAQSRRIVYGELAEVGRDLLAMTPTEGRALLGGRQDTDAARIERLASGWPAVLGLAAVTAGSPRWASSTAALYEFFADEVVRAGTARLQEALPLLAIPPRPIVAAVKTVIPDVDEVLDEARSLGLVSGTNREPELHPLLRTFLHTRSSERKASRGEAAAIAAALISAQCYDDAFDVATEFELEDTLALLLERGSASLLIEGRVETLQRWHRAALDIGVTSPVVDLVEAQLLAYEGKHSEAVDSAVAAASAFGRDHPLYCEAALVAAQGAYLSDRFDEAIGLYAEARAAARSDAERREALYGSISMAIENGASAADVMDDFRDLATIRPGEPETVERVASVGLAIAAFCGDLAPALGRARAAARVVHRVRNPVKRSAFYNMYSLALALHGDYQQAVGVSEAGIADAERVRLEFAMPHLSLRHATALIGLRRFSDAARELDRVLQQAKSLGDEYIFVSALALRTRLLISEGLIDQACELAADVEFADLTTLIRGEALASRALAEACAGNAGAATSSADAAEDATTNAEVLAIARMARAVVNAASPENAAYAARAAHDTLDAGFVDPVVCALRGSRDLRHTLRDERDGVDPRLVRVLRRVNDLKLLRDLGLTTSVQRRRTGDAELLTPREREVLELVRQGARNRDIAKALFVSEVTVKVHLRHIFEKLGARTRTEAALLAERAAQAATTEDPSATST